jgi:hypothetical protein
MFCCVVVVLAASTILSMSHYPSDDIPHKHTNHHHTSSRKTSHVKQIPIMMKNGKHGNGKV